MIRSSKCYFRNFCNAQKYENLLSFLSEYRRVAGVYLDYLWGNRVEFRGQVFDIKNELFDLPLFLDKSMLPQVSTDLSGRALKCCSTQVREIIAAAIRKKQKSEYVLKTYNKRTKHYDDKFSKPDLTNLKPELNSLCCNFQKSDKHFNGFLQLSSIGKKYGKIRIPVKFHRHINGLRGELKNSFLISDKYIVFRKESSSNIKESGKTVGADQGLKTVLTLSDGQSTPAKDIHGHSLESIIAKMSRQKRGSNNFRKSQEHRKNFINWSINRLNLSNIRELRLEKVTNINFGRRASRKMRAWTNTDIRDKVERLAEEKEVLFLLQDSAYRSQRCSRCGQVRKSNRKGKVYSCKNCGFVSDSDANAAMNHAQDLPDVPFFLRKKGMNLGNGFFWKSSGFYSFSGSELTVPDS